jgi:hypothetical protein
MTMKKEILVEGRHATGGNSASHPWLAFVEPARQVWRVQIGMSVSRFRGV